MRKRTILYLCDHGFTGIAESCYHQVRHWHDQGHEIWGLVLGFNGWTAGLKEDRFPWKERILRINGTSGETRFGQGDIRRALDLCKADVVISSYDVWMVRYLAQPEQDEWLKKHPDDLKPLTHEDRTFTHIAYFPLDGAIQNKYLPAGLDEWISGFDVPITYSKFAQQIVRNDIGIDIPMIPIGHDPAVFKPMDKNQSRLDMSLPTDKFIVGMVATNQYRKRWDEFLAACGRFAKGKDDVLIIPWTTWDKQIQGGFWVNELVYRNGLNRCSINPNQYVGDVADTTMALLYNSMDVHVLTTIGEGAGLPPLRARACGVPSLVSDNTSNSEFTTDAFERIPSRISHLDNGSGLARFSTNVDVLVERLEYLYKNRDYARNLGERGVLAMQPYEIANILPQWDAVLETLP